jgi:ribosomal subunit interface protein
MIQKFEISSVHTKVDDDLRKYVIKKIGRLDRYISRHMRKTVHIEVKLKENKSKDKNQYTCETVVYLPQEVLNVKETTINMYAAIDIVEDKLRTQLRKYKAIHANPTLHRRALARLKHQAI